MYTVAIPDGAVAVLVSLGGDNGFFRIPVTSDTGEQALNITLLQGFTGDTLEVSVATVDAAGETSEWTTETVAVVQTQTGEVKISLTWDADEDLDLLVWDPEGNRIDSANPTSPTGGALDLDSNAWCEIDGVNNENVSWSAENAVSGEYTVGVMYFQQCSAATTEVNATVTVTLGDQVSTYVGTFVPADACADSEAGCTDDDVHTFTFTY